MAASSQCSVSSGGASAGGNCEPCSSNDLELFDSESDVSGGCEVTSLLDRLKSPSPAGIARLRKTVLMILLVGTESVGEHLCRTQRVFLQVNE